jgi:hypothetical protein
MERNPIMVKAIASSVVVALIIGSVAMGGIAQRQTMDAGILSEIDLPQGPNAQAATTQDLLLVDVQGAGNAYGAVALQGQGILIGQSGRARGLCGGLSLTQGVSGGEMVIGDQAQQIANCCGPSSEEQALGFVAGQALGKANCAPGEVRGGQIIGTAQAQFATNSAMTMGEGALIIGGQTASITGGIGTVTQTMIADTAQTQTVN